MILKKAFRTAWGLGALAFHLSKLDDLVITGLFRVLNR